MYDLIYAGRDESRARYELLERFPDAVIEDASDFIHQGRFSIEVDVLDEEYYLVILDLGMFTISLNFQIFMRQKPDLALALMKQWKSGKDIDLAEGR